MKKAGRKNLIIGAINAVKLRIKNMKKDDRENLIIGTICAGKILADFFIIWLLSKRFEWISAIFLIPYLLAGFLLFFIYQLLVDSIVIIFSPAPPIPEIQYAEFPFEIVYEVDGQIYEISDSVVCEYDGISYEYGVKSLDWNTYLKKSGENILDVYFDESNHSDVCLYVGDVDYYMYGKTDEYGHLPGEYFYSGSFVAPPYTFEILKEQYGIEIISCKFSEPLKENKREYRTIDKIRRFLSFEY